MKNGRLYATIPEILLGMFLRRFVAYFYNEVRLGGVRREDGPLVGRTTTGENAWEL